MQVGGVGIAPAFTPVEFRDKHLVVTYACMASAALAGLMRRKPQAQASGEGHAAGKWVAADRAVSCGIRRSGILHSLLALVLLARVIHCRKSALALSGC